MGSKSREGTRWKGEGQLSLSLWLTSHWSDWVTRPLYLQESLWRCLSLFLFFRFIYLFLRERERERENALSGERQRERERERESQAGSTLAVQSLKRGLTSGKNLCKIMTWPEIKSPRLDQLSHPGTPVGSFNWACYTTLQKIFGFSE